MVRWRCMADQTWRSRGGLMLAGGVALGGLLLTSCALPGTPAPAPNANIGTVHIAGAPVVVPPPTIVVTPGNSSQGVALDAPVVVNVATGHLDTVSLSQAGASTVFTGAMSAAGTLWEMSSPLAPAAHYTVVATATSSAGQTSTSTTTFVTVAAKSRLLTGMTPLDGAVVGVGETIDLRFN